MTHRSSQSVVWEGFVSLEIPPDWEWSEDDGTISIYHPDRVGALQVSFGHGGARKGKPDLDRFSRDLAEDLGVVPDARRRTSLGGLAAAYLEGRSVGDDARYWRIWHAARGAEVARVTYTSAVDDRETEGADVDHMLQSCRWLF